MAQSSLAICFSVWGRPDLLKVCFESLIPQLDGIEASVWIFDNGSDAPTRDVIESLKSDKHRLFKIGFPQNMGIPFVVNVFSQMLTQNCDFVGYHSASHIMVADSDIYFKRPILEMIEILEADSQAGIISGHDSVEYAALNEYSYSLRDGPRLVKEKSLERGACLIMKKDILAACVPFPHSKRGSVDWELMTWNANSMEKRRLKVLAVDSVVHLGLYDSTWHPMGVPADQAEVDEINQVLTQEGLFSPARKMRMEKYCQAFKLQPISADRRRLGIGEASLWVAQTPMPDGRTSDPGLPRGAPYTLGDAIDFTTNGNAAPYLVRGWTGSEPWGTWTDGDMAILRLAPTPRPKGDLILSIRAFGLIAPQIPRQEVEVQVNGRPAGSWVFESAGMAERELRLPTHLLHDVIEIAFVPKNARAPAELGISPDTRRLGMVVAEVTLRASMQ